jgi:CrcB protein
VTALVVLLGAAAGAPARWLVDLLVRRRLHGVFPWGTVVINVAGSLLLGVVLGASNGATALVAGVGTGFCGGFTTFSSFGFETVRLVEDRDYVQGVANVGASLCLGLLAAFAGWQLGRLI